MTDQFRVCRTSVIAALSAAVFLTSSIIGLAQTAAPPASTPTAAPSSAPPSPPTTAAPATPATLKCDARSKPLEVGGAGLPVDANSGAQHKNWQPSGGEIAYTVRSFSEFETKARVLACFRWKTDTHDENFYSAEISRVELSSDSKILKIVMNVPHLPSTDTVKGQLVRTLGLVPIAEVRILIQDSKSAQPFEVVTSIGITNPFWAGGAAFVVGILAFGWLWIVVSGTLTKAGVPKVNPFLAVISTPYGYASLSQFQIVMWTFVVLMSAVYVMALSGELIQITTGTLILLGISGATTVASKITSDSQYAAPAVNPLAPAPPPPPPPLPHPKPLLSDLITNTVPVTIAGALQNKIEIDVTRVQMLFFTLITATFVGIKVFSTYVIPEIPDGFQILMGISNAVYMGQKVTQK